MVGLLKGWWPLRGSLSYGVCACVHTYLHVCMYVCMYIYMYKYVYIYICIYIYTCAEMLCTYTWIYIYIFIYLFTGMYRYTGLMRSYYTLDTPAHGDHLRSWLLGLKTSAWQGSGTLRPHSRGGWTLKKFGVSTALQLVKRMAWGHQTRKPKKTLGM